MKKIKNIHFVGIGGIGMSGIAEVLMDLGYEVSGSDLSSNENISRLAAMGCKVMTGHDANNIERADVLVVSSAINDANPEVCAAREASIPVVPRAEMLSELMRFKRGIAISGTHGKTTTTSMIAHMLDVAGLSPTYVIGGRLRKNDKNAHLGDGDYFVVEADESDGTFLYFHPLISVVTNIDNDHLSVYGNSFENLMDAFRQFSSDVPFYGCTVLCAEDRHIRELIPDIHRRTYTYGTTEDCSVWYTDYCDDETGMGFRVRSVKHDIDMPVHMPVHGRYNALNALACTCVGIELGINQADIASALGTFSGIARRFNIYDVRSGDGVPHTVIDDYGHHPREISSVVNACKELYEGRRLVVIFEPHRYSRVSALYDEFVESLAAADYCVILPIYSAGETDHHDVSSADLCAGIRDVGMSNVHCLADISGLSVLLERVVEPDDVLLFLGAGSIGNIVKTYLKANRPIGTQA